MKKKEPKKRKVKFENHNQKRPFNIMNYQKLRLALRPEDPLQIRKNAILKYKKELLRDVLNKKKIVVKQEPNLTRYIQEEVYNKGTYLSIKKHKFYERVNALDLKTEVIVKSKFGTKFGVSEFNSFSKNIYAVPLSGDEDSLMKYQNSCIQQIAENNEMKNGNEQMSENTDFEQFAKDLQFYEPLYKRDVEAIKSSLNKLGVLKKEPGRVYIELVCTNTSLLHPEVDKLNTYPLDFSKDITYIEDKKEHESIIKQLIRYIVSTRNYENFKGNP